MLAHGLVYQVIEVMLMQTVFFDVAYYGFSSLSLPEDVQCTSTDKIDDYSSCFATPYQKY